MLQLAARGWPPRIGKPEDAVPGKPTPPAARRALRVGAEVGTIGAAAAATVAACVAAVRRMARAQ